MCNDFKIIPTPEFKKKIFYKKSWNNHITSILEEILNLEAKKGWEFIDIKTIRIPIRASFFRSNSEKTISIMLFKKAQQDTKLPQGKKYTSNDENFPSLGPAIKD